LGDDGHICKHGSTKFVQIKKSVRTKNKGSPFNRQRPKDTHTHTHIWDLHIRHLSLKREKNLSRSSQATLGCNLQYRHSWKAGMLSSEACSWTLWQMVEMATWLRLHRHGQAHLLTSSENSGDVKVEEVTVEDSLHHSGHHSDLVEEALGVVAPDPVGQVEGPVQAEEQQVVCGDGLGLTRVGDHEQLWQNGHRLQVDGEGPEDLQWSKGIVLQKGQASHRNQQELHTERIVVRIKGVPKAHVYQVYRSVGQSQEHYLHDGVVERDEAGEQIQVSGGED